MFHSPPILAFGFVSLPMLGWLAAAAVPIAIHLWNRQRRQEVRSAAMEYLMAAVRQQAHRLRFQQWLLLLIRTLLIVLIVTAVAEPYSDRSGPALTSGAPTHRVLVLDGSYSMAYQPTDKSRFEKAKELARQMVEGSPQGDAFTLVRMSSPPKVIVGTPTFDPSALLREIDNLELSHTSADLPATVSALLSLLENVRRSHPRLLHHEICFLSDLQRVTWLPSRSAGAKADLVRRTAELAQAAWLTVIDLGQSAAENLAITNVRTLDPAPTVGRAVTLNVDLRQFGRNMVHAQRVELLIDGRRVAQKQIDVPANTETSLEFTHRFDAPGDHVVEVCAPGDALEVDNHRYLTLPVREAIRVLCIDGHPSSAAYHGAADYLALALAPEDGHAESGVIRPEVAAESALSECNLNAYDCVFLCNIAQFTAGEVGVLDGYLKSGGSLVFFLGDQVMAEQYNRALCGRAGKGGPNATRPISGAEKDAGSIPNLLPARLGGIVDHAQFRVDPLEYRHPIVQTLRGRGEVGLLTTPVFKHFKLEVSAVSPAKTTLALADGDPLIVEQTVHGGRVVLVATSADASWTAMPLWPSFVPLVQEIVAWCAGASLQQRNILVGQPITPSLPVAASDVSLAVQSPDGRDHQVALHAGRGGAPFCDIETAQSGVYTARLGPPLNRSQAFAVNVDTAESDLTVIGSDKLRNEVWPGIRFTYRAASQTSWQGAETSADSGPFRDHNSLPITLLYAVVGLLLLETFIAWRFGRFAT